MTDDGLAASEFRFDPPDFDHLRLAAVAADHWGIVGRIEQLPGERDQNCLVTSRDGRCFVLKLASANEAPEVVALQIEALLHIEQADPDLPAPRIMRTLAGGLSVEVSDDDGIGHLARLVTFVPGVTFGGRAPLAASARRGVGGFQGRLSLALMGFDHPGAMHHMPWDINNGLIVDDRLWANLAPDARVVMDPVERRLADAAEAMTVLRRQTIHNDGHRGNLLRADELSESVTGIIDFGDLVHTVVAADLGVSGASFACGEADPVGALLDLVVGYDDVRRLDDDEVDQLVELVLARLALSLLLVEFQVGNVPHLAAAADEDRVRLLVDLVDWAAIDPHRAGDRLRSGVAAGRDAGGRA